MNSVAGLKDSKYFSHYHNDQFLSDNIGHAVNSPNLENGKLLLNCTDRLTQGNI